jgi:hypothetical protein
MVVSKTERKTNMTTDPVTGFIIWLGIVGIAWLIFSIIGFLSVLGGLVAVLKRYVEFKIEQVRWDLFTPAERAEREAAYDAERITVRDAKRVAREKRAAMWKRFISWSEKSV